ncbi:MAG: phosphoribosylformylglycinamidine synthase subunit PurQ [Ignavibacteria bacterium]|nr:phosphoribosylformylglycinamidine synthase subunit PurQ [Ignavibacteria bacterium]
MKFGIVVFPGSNCDHDAWYATSHSAGAQAQMLWHKDTIIPSDIDCVILPGGFSYGDYLRCGAIARVSPIMSAVRKHAEQGRFVLGICNGFQILTESGLLPGVLLRNVSLSFICKDIHLRTEQILSPFTSSFDQGQILRVPIAHGEGNYFADEQTIHILEQEQRIAFRYCDANGNATIEANPNGSINNIAGILNDKGNVLGMMPHPERCCDPLLGNSDGLGVFTSLMQTVGLY